jgi:GAF domain-containing protein
VLLTKEPRALTLDDPVVDEAEARLLRELGFGALLMTPLEINGELWGLVEVYRIVRRPYTEAEIRRALELSRLR